MPTLLAALVFVTQGVTLGWLYITPLGYGVRIRLGLTKSIESDPIDSRETHGFLFTFLFSVVKSYSGGIIARFSMLAVVYLNKWIFVEYITVNITETSTY
ncbi:MAG: hypothetical protein D3917_16830 [Candidatus Electrothrix sp. AX5]|nr:hypothetical protein [Candidatus Electrothrix sp. AX5]